MQEIITAEQLAVKVAERDRRAQIIATEEGMNETRRVMISLFEYMRSCGYKIPEANYKSMSEIWADLLRDYIVAYGFGVIRDAVKAFVRENASEYKTMPTPAQIIAKAKQLGHDPLAESRRREHEQKVQRMRDEYTEKARVELTDEKREAFRERFPDIEAALKEVVNE